MPPQSILGRPDVSRNRISNVENIGPLPSKYARLVLPVGSCWRITRALGQTVRDRAKLYLTVLSYTNYSAIYFYCFCKA